MSIIKELFCNHDYQVDSHTYGDMIFNCGMNRTILKCKKCGKYKAVEPFIKTEFNWNDLNKPIKFWRY